ncbi:flagellar basal body protein [Hahella sp. CCB-MM4]|uniref:flagellar basal body rod protein FlgB n=1 Tax=Hahella sp. (strain CCB-MM4) TaxID=1926491 RepID=UPI000B9BAA56|nr:flagellar basal body protein [Hahella sp. CCB-MM4]OZG74848.1 flagellar basal body protein [Hahella sp. CCB-MM4]
MEYLTSVTSTLLNRSLDVAQLQQMLIAQNVANAGVEGYRQVSVDFSSLMERMEDISHGKSTDDFKKAALQQVEISDYIKTSELPSKVELDQQMVELNKAVINYQALLTAKSKLGSIMKNVISGGRS